jgi:hypothetical protein
MGRKKSSELTALQRQALECVRGAQASGVSLSAYCRGRRIAVRQVFDALVALRRRGEVGATMAKPASSKFAAVEISSQVPALPPRTALCRVVLAGGIAVECASWPPREWLMSLSSGADAAA